MTFVSRFALDFMSSDEDCGSCTAAPSPILESEKPSQKLVCRSIDVSDTSHTDNNDRCTTPPKKRKRRKQTDAKTNDNDFDVSSLKVESRHRDHVESPSSPIRQQSRDTAAKKRVTNDDAAVVEHKANKHKRQKRVAVVCTTADEMVRAACLNIHNTDSIDMMEWSEAVLLCLASPTAYDVLDRLSWSDVQTICADNEWSVKIASAIKHHISRSDTLNTLLCRNRREKVQRRYLTAAQTDMFYATPHVNMKLLKTYIPLIQVHARTKFNKALLHTRS